MNTLIFLDWPDAVRLHLIGHECSSRALRSCCVFLISVYPAMFSFVHTCPEAQLENKLLRLYVEITGKGLVWLNIEIRSGSLPVDCSRSCLRLQHLPRCYSKYVLVYVLLWNVSFYSLFINTCTSSKKILNRTKVPVITFYFRKNIHICLTLFLF